MDFQDQRLFETEVIKEKAYLKYQDLRILYTVPKYYLILCDALYLDILFYIHDDISLLRLWNQDLPYVYNSTFKITFLFTFSSSSLFAASSILISTSNFSQVQSESHLPLKFLFNYKINILVPQLHLACLSMEWCWNEERLSIQLLL